MPTQRQKKVAQELVKNLDRDAPHTAGEIVENSGYGKSMKKNSHVVINSDGVKEELATLGFDEVSAKQVVGNIMLNEESQDQNRLKAADMVFKINGSYAPEKKLSVNANLEFKNDKRAEELADEYEDKLRKEYLK